MPMTVRSVPSNVVVARMNRPSGKPSEPVVSTSVHPNRLHRTTFLAPRFSSLVQPDSSLLTVSTPSGIDSGNASVRQIISASWQATSWRDFSNLGVPTLNLSACVFQFRIFITCAIHSSGYRGACFYAEAVVNWKLNFRPPPIGRQSWQRRIEHRLFCEAFDALNVGMRVTIMCCDLCNNRVNSTVPASLHTRPRRRLYQKLHKSRHDQARKSPPTSNRARGPLIRSAPL